jgi:CheY-like chemotaxis protein
MCGLPAAAIGAVETCGEAGTPAAPHGAFPHAIAAFLGMAGRSALGSLVAMAAHLNFVPGPPGRTDAARNASPAARDGRAVSHNRRLGSDPDAGGGARPIRVVLADDHSTARRNLRLLLGAEEGMNVIGEAGDLGGMLREVQERHPHVVVLDLQMPSGSSIEAIRYLRSHAPATEVVVSTMERSPLFARQALDAGALGFVLKEHADSELPQAVRDAVAGREYVSSRVAAALTDLGRAG